MASAMVQDTAGKNTRIYSYTTSKLAVYCGNDEIFLKREKLIHSYKVKMAAFNEFDMIFDAVANDGVYKLRIGVTGHDFSYYCNQYFRNPSLTKIFPVELNELKFHHNFFFSPALIEPTKEWVFVTAYATYSMFWASLELRICSLIYSKDPQYAEISGNCEKLSRYAHFITYLFFERKIFYFQRIEKLSEDEGQDWKRNIFTRKTVDSLLRGVTFVMFREFTADGIGDLMKNLNLEFIMEEDYMETYRKIRERSNVDARLKLVNTDEFVAEELAKIVDPSKTLKENYYAIWTEVIKMFKSKVVLIENYFLSVFPGKIPIELPTYFLNYDSVQNLKRTPEDLIPEFESSIMAKTDTISKLMLMKQQVTFKPRHSFEDDNSPSILRSNIIDIVKALEEIKFIRKLDSLQKEDNSQSGTTNFDNLKTYKRQSGFFLARNEKLGVDYSAGIKTSS